MTFNVTDNKQPEPTKIINIYTMHPFFTINQLNTETMIPDIYLKKNRVGKRQFGYYKKYVQYLCSRTHYSRTFPCYNKQ